MEFVFKVGTPLGFSVRCTRRQWEFIIGEKHPVMADKKDDVQSALEDPDEVRKSRKDERVLLFYRKRGERYFCAVVRTLDGEAFLITTYPTDAIKIGEILWTRSR